jgi:hypothetical protein
MKIDMRPRAITLRLKQVSLLRRTCLALAQSSAGGKIQEKSKANESVQRTSKSLGQ